MIFFYGDDFDLCKVFEHVDHNQLLETLEPFGFYDKNILNFPPTAWTVTSHCYFILFLIGFYVSGNYSSFGKLVVSKGFKLSSASVNFVLLQYLLYRVSIY